VRESKSQLLLILPRVARLCLQRLAVAAAVPQYAVVAVRAAATAHALLALPAPRSRPRCVRSVVARASNAGALPLLPLPSPRCVGQTAALDHGSHGCATIRAHEFPCPRAQAASPAVTRTTSPGRATSASSSSVPLASTHGPALPVVTFTVEPLGLTHRPTWPELLAVARAELRPPAGAPGIVQTLRSPLHHRHGARGRIFAAADRTPLVLCSWKKKAR
jgi:hypothetical protein